MVRHAHTAGGYFRGRIHLHNSCDIVGLPLPSSFWLPKSSTFRAPDPPFCLGHAKSNMFDHAQLPVPLVTHSHHSPPNRQVNHNHNLQLTYISTNRYLCSSSLTTFSKAGFVSNC